MTGVFGPQVTLSSQGGENSTPSPSRATPAEIVPQILEGALEIVGKRRKKKTMADIEKRDIADYLGPGYQLNDVQKSILTNGSRRSLTGCGSCAQS